MLKLIIGTPTKVLEWFNGANDNADFTNAWDSQLSITQSLLSGDITGTDEGEKSIMLMNHRCPSTISKNWQLWIVNATRTISGSWTLIEKVFGGIITGWSEEVAGGNNENLAKTLNVKASSFHKEISRLRVKQQTKVNQYTDRIMKAVIAESTDNTVIKTGSLARPSERISVVRFNNERNTLSALQALAELDDETHELIITPVLTSSFAGAEITFREIVKEYAPVILDEALRASLGPGNSPIEPSTIDQYNIVTLPFYEEAWRESERHLQITTTSEAELNSRVPLVGIPASIEACKLYQDYFGSDVKSDVILENDLTNPDPPEWHLDSEGYILQGEINFVQGMHFLDASEHIPHSPEWGEIARISDPEEILFEAQKNTQLRVKEVTISTSGDGILCSYLDLNSISSVITNVISTTIFDVEDGSRFAEDQLAIINTESRVISGITGNRITLRDELSSAPEIGDECELSYFNKSRIISGLEFRADGTLWTVENGVSSSSGQSYAEETIYTIRNHCFCPETYTTDETDTAVIPVNSTAEFSANTIIEIHINGNNTDPVETKVIGKDSGAETITITESIGTIPANTTIRSKPRPELSINGGAFGEASGKVWTKLGSGNTIQTEPNQQREIGFCIIMQKSLEGTIKEFKASHYPPISLIIDGKQKIVSTPDDSAEKDVDAFINARNERYFIELPSDTKPEWASGTILEVQYKEKRMREIKQSDLDSIETIAIERGCPILESDSMETRERKGGMPAPKEELIPNPLTFLEANNLTTNILKEHVKRKYKVELKNLNNVYHGEFWPGQWLPIRIDDINDEIPIDKVQKKLVGQVNDSLLWEYEISANVVSQVAQLLKKAGNTSRKILDDASDDTVVQTPVYGFNEKMVISDPVNTHVDYYTANVLDVRIGSTPVIIEGYDYENVTLVDTYPIGDFDQVYNIFQHNAHIFATGKIAFGNALLTRYNQALDQFVPVMEMPVAVLYSWVAFQSWLYFQRVGSTGYRYNDYTNTTDDFSLDTSNNYVYHPYQTKLLMGVASPYAKILQSTDGLNYSDYWDILDHYLDSDPRSGVPVVSIKSKNNTDLVWITAYGEVWHIGVAVYQFDDAHTSIVRPLEIFKNSFYASNGVTIVKSDYGDNWTAVSLPADCSEVKNFYVSPDGENLIIVGARSTGGEHGAAWYSADGNIWTLLYFNEDYDRIVSMLDDGINQWFGVEAAVLKTTLTRIPRVTGGGGSGEMVEYWADERHLLTYKAE